MKNSFSTPKSFRLCNDLERLQQWLWCLQEPGFESHLQPIECFTCNKVSLLNNCTLTLTSVLLCPNKLAPCYQGHIQSTQPKQLKKTDVSPYIKVVDINRLIWRRGRQLLIANSWIFLKLEFWFHFRLLIVAISYF